MRPKERSWLRTRTTGPVVGAVQSVFSENWVEQTSEPIVGERFFPPLAAAGPVPDPPGGVDAELGNRGLGGHGFLATPQ